MSSRHLFEPITDNGISNVNFFNGRLLTADDLTAVLGAGRDHDRQLAKGIGEGVVHGLEVELASSSTPTQPVVRVGSGLALTRSGNPVALSVPTVDVALVRAPATFPPEAGLFAECEGPAPADGLSNLGVYVFVASPASTLEGSVPMRHSVTNDKFDRCGRRFAVEGVKFRMERVNFSTLPGVSNTTRSLLATLTAQTDAAGVSKLRSVIAHLCFDSEEATGLRRDPFRKNEAGRGLFDYGVLAELRALKQLTDCDVPLAVIYWSPQGVRFVDNWAARRLARRPLDLEVLSLLRGYGYERLLQFQRHLQELFDTPGTLSAAALQNYFAFVPPAGFYHVTGAESPRGFHPTNFFKQFTTGQPSDTTAERFGALLRDSFACPDVALGSNPVFTIFRVRDNSAAVAADASTQLYHAFVSRSLFGPLLQDGVAGTLRDAWEVYRGLIKRRVFLPSGTSQDTLAAQHSITNAVRDVLDMSNRQHTLAASAALDTPSALAAFHDMHRVQKEFAALLAALPLADPTKGRASFAQGLIRLLDTTPAGAKPGLLPAVQAGNLPAAVVAQNAINFYVGNWSGEGVAIGPFGATWQSSPQGKNLVRGQSFPHHFTVRNGTDKRLVIRLEASAAAQTGDWAGSTAVTDVSGAALSGVELASGASTEVVVNVTAPRDAKNGESVTLTLKTIVDPPTDKTTQATLSDLTVSDEGGQGVTSAVEFFGEVIAPASDEQMANADPAKPYSYTYTVRYLAPQGVTQPGNFLVTLTLTSANLSGWQAGFGDTSTPGGDPAAGVYTEQIQLVPSQLRQIEVIILTPQRGAADRTATFTLRVEGVNMEPAPQPAVSPAKSVTVRKG